MPAIFEHAARQLNGILDTLDRCHSTGAQRRALHDRRIHLDLTQTVEGGTGPGIEQRIILKDDHRGFGAIDGAAAGAENLPPRQRRRLAALKPRRQTVVFDRPRTAMNDDRRCELNHVLFF